MGKLGRDPKFFTHVEGAVSEKILTRAHYAFTTLNPAKNPYLSFILKGSFADCLPHYLEPENFAIIKNNIDNLKIHRGAINEVAQEYGKNYFSGFNLSDIYEYLTPEQTEHVYGDLLNSSKTGARFTYWNMLVPRTCPSSLSQRVILKDSLSKELFDQDYAFFYSRFVVEEVL